MNKMLNESVTGVPPEIALEKEDIYRFLIENSNDIIYVLNLAGEITFLSPSWTAIVGYSRETAIGQMFHQFIHPEDQQRCFEYRQRMLDTGETVTGLDYRVKCRDGQWRWHTATSTPIKSKSGEINGFIGTARDIEHLITERKKQEKAFIHLNSLMRYIIEHNQSAVAVHDKNLNYMFVSRQYLESYQVREQDIIGRHHYEVFPDLPQKWRDVHQRVLKGEVLSGDDDPYMRENGMVEWTRWECRPWYEADGSIGGIIVYTDVITERKQMQQTILKEREQFKTTLLSVGDAVISTDNHGQIEIMNKVAEKLTGWNFEDAYGKPLEEIFQIENEFTHEICENPVDIALKTGDTVSLANHTVLVAKDGRKIPIEDSAAPIKGSDNAEITGVVLVFRDFTEKREKQKQVEYLSLHDQLTGLYNRRFFEEELKRLDTPRNYPLSLVMLDVNGLKLINDAFGHKSGDSLLQKVAAILNAQCRSDEIISRVGGDEFMILLPRTDEQEAQKLVERIKRSMAEESIEGIQLSVSFGTGTKDDSNIIMDEVIKKAEDLMYRDKIFDRNNQRYGAIQMIMRTLHEKTPRERLHSSRVGDLCGKIGMAMGLNQDEIRALITAGELHDIGKIAISNEILYKIGTLTDTEWLEIKRHPEVGYNILSSSNAFAPLADIVLAHHERWDGTGFPNGLKGEEIPVSARIIAVADFFDAMMEDMPYRKARSMQDVIEELKNCSGAQFDPTIADLFINKVIPQLKK